MTTRRRFLVGSGAAAVGTTLGTGSALASVLGADRNRARGADILAEKPALREPWSLARTTEIFGTNTPGPYWPKAEMVSFTTEIDSTTAKLWLPPPLVPTDPARATVFVARYPMTKLGFGYNEAGVYLHGTHADRTYMHCTWMVVDDDTALILGRERLGFPKKMAVIDANVLGAAPLGRVERKGLPVIDVVGNNVRATDLAAASAASEVNRITIVNVVGDPRSGGKLLQINGEQKLHRAEAVDLEVTFGNSDLDPLYRLGMASSQTGTIAVVDIRIRGKQEVAPEEQSLTGIEVSEEWMARAYPFRVW